MRKREKSVNFRSRLIIQYTNYIHILIPLRDRREREVLRKFRSLIR
jgi:hypothetical protein